MYLKPGAYADIRALISTARSAGYGDLFDRDRLRWWGRTIAHRIFGEHFFVSQEIGWNGTPGFTVRIAMDSGEVYPVTGLQEFRYYAPALRKAAFLAGIERTSKVDYFAEPPSDSCQMGNRNSGSCRERIFARIDGRMTCARHFAETAIAVYREN